MSNNTDQGAPTMAHAAVREIERLIECLKIANANHEHFEREWHLRGDELETLRKEFTDLREFIEAKLKEKTT